MSDQTDMQIVSPLHLLPPLASANWTHVRSLTPAWCLFSKARGIAHAANAVRSAPGMSVQPDIPIFILALPSSWDVGYLAQVEVKPLHVAFS